MPKISVLSKKINFVINIILGFIPKTGTIIIRAVYIRPFLSFALFFDKMSQEPTERNESYVLYRALELLENQFTLHTIYLVEIA